MRNKIFCYSNLGNTHSMRNKLNDFLWWYENTPHSYQDDEQCCQNSISLQKEISGEKSRFNCNSLAEDAPIGLLKSEFIADLFFALSVSHKAWTGITQQMKLSGQRHTFLLSQVNFSLGNIPRLSPRG